MEKYFTAGQATDGNIVLCFVDRAALYNLLQIEPAWCTNFLNMFIAFLYMFRATMCPSSGENTVPGICHSETSG